MVEEDEDVDVDRNRDGGRKQVYTTRYATSAFSDVAPPELQKHVQNFLGL